MFRPFDFLNALLTNSLHLKIELLQLVWSEKRLSPSKLLFKVLNQCISSCFQNALSSIYAMIFVHIRQVRINWLLWKKYFLQNKNDVDGNQASYWIESLKGSKWDIVRFLYCIRKTKTRINIVTHIMWNTSLYMRKCTQIKLSALSVSLHSSHYTACSAFFKKKVTSSLLLSLHFH